MKEEDKATYSELVQSALQHGLKLKPESIALNESGMDFRVAFASDTEGRDWILRIPRRADVLTKVKYESKVLQLAGEAIGSQVPDWQIETPELIAYPRLSGTPIAVIDLSIMNYVWSIDPENLTDAFISSLARTMAEIHSVSTAKAADSGLHIFTPGQSKSRMEERMQIVKSGIGVAEPLWQRWQQWLNHDELWPDYSVFIHGDLQAAHILINEHGEVNGLLDWTEAEVADPAVDFVLFLATFGEEALQKLLEEYSKAGGRTWPLMSEHIREMQAAYPVAIGVFALQTGEEDHLKMARHALGLV